MTGTSLFAIIIVILVVTKTQRLINKFRNKGAINEKNAKTLDELKVNRRLMLRKYLLYSIIIETDGKYYLNEQNLKNFKTKKRIILIPLLVILILLLIYLDITLT